MMVMYWLCRNDYYNFELYAYLPVLQGFLKWWDKNIAEIVRISIWSFGDWEKQKRKNLTVRPCFNHSFQAA